jgi:hypothetical protein
MTDQIMSGVSSAKVIQKRRQPALGSESLQAAVGLIFPVQNGGFTEW